MKDRADLRRYFTEKADNEASQDLLSEQSALLSEISDLQVETFNKLLLFLDNQVTKTEVVNQLRGYATTQDINRIASMLSKLDKTILAGKIDLKPVIEAVNKGTEEVKAIEPAKFEQKDEVKVSNLSEIKLDNSAVEKAIKALKLDVKVDAPIINTEKTDLKPLKDVMMDLLKATNKQKPFKDGDSVVVKNLKDIPPADLKEVEKKLDEANKLLKKINEKKFGGGGGGGGNGSPYTDSQGITKNVELGQQLAGSSVPVVLPAAQITTLTPPGAITGFATEATLAKIPGLSIPLHDEIVLSYTGDNLTGVVYKLATVTKATLTLSYTGSNLIGVVRT